jgi:hypothetical protein
MVERLLNIAELAGVVQALPLTLLLLQMEVPVME